MECWVIAHQYEPNQVMYFTALKEAWTRDTDQAIRFVRGQDANRMIEHLGLGVTVKSQKITVVSSTKIVAEPMASPFVLDPLHCEVCADQAERIQFSRCGEHMK